MKKSVLILFALVSPAMTWGQTGYNARSMGLAGAYQGLARGSEVSRWNPANLALPDNPTVSVEFFGVGLNLGNNSLNIKLYNDYFSQDYSDAHGGWDEAAKREILSAFPDQGFRAFDRIQITPLAFSYRQYALAFNSFIYSDLSLPQDLFAIPLMGLNTDPTQLMDAAGEAVAGTEMAISAAREIKLNWDRLQFFSAGGTVKVLMGHAYAQVVDASGLLLSNADSIVIDGSYRAELAGLFADQGKTGWGFGLDLGAAAQVNKKLSLGLTLSNLIGFLRFGNHEEYQGSFSFHQPGLNIDEFDHFEDYLDSLSVSTDTNFVSTASLSYRMPVALALSGTYLALKELTLELDYHQGLNNTAGGTTTPRFALGAEYRRLKVLPLRCGFGLGGVQGTTLAFGLGLDLKHYQLDIAAAGQRGLFNHSKGISLALSQRILF